MASIGFYAFYILPAPVITLSDFSFVTSNCTRLGNSSTRNYTFFFTLVNSGTSDGFAQVFYYMDGSIAYFYRYFVSRTTSQRIIWSIDWPDCNTHTPSVAIAAVSEG